MIAFENNAILEKCIFIAFLFIKNVWVGYFLEGKRQKQDLERCSKSL